jgi:hypothetical protein
VRHTTMQVDSDLLSFVFLENNIAAFPEGRPVIVSPIHIPSLAR